MLKDEVGVEAMVDSDGRGRRPRWHPDMDNQDPKA